MARCVMGQTGRSSPQLRMQRYEAATTCECKWDINLYASEQSIGSHTNAEMYTSGIKINGTR